MDLQKQKIVNDIALIYAQALTEAELKDVIAFFKSPSGKKYVESQPVVLDEMVREMQLVEPGSRRVRDGADPRRDAEEGLPAAVSRFDAA